MEIILLPQDTLNSENIYWLFSASAQSIAALIAFILTGFALMHNIMENLQQRDETLEEIHTKLKQKHYRQIKWLSFFTGLAIIFSLLMLYLNSYNFQYKTILIMFTSILNIIAIVLGLTFVISIINPQKYVKTAKELIKEEEKVQNVSEEKVNEKDFFRKFINLEITIRDILKNLELYEPSISSPKMSFSFRQMIRALYEYEIIDHQVYERLLEINKYRNLVFHGHVLEASKDMQNKVNELNGIISKIDISKIKKKN